MHLVARSVCVRGALMQTSIISKRTITSWYYTMPCFLVVVGSKLLKSPSLCLHGHMATAGGAEQHLLGVHVPECRSLLVRDDRQHACDGLPDHLAAQRQQTCKIGAAHHTAAPLWQRDIHWTVHIQPWQCAHRRVTTQTQAAKQPPTRCRQDLTSRHWYRPEHALRRSGPHVQRRP